jgi:hypothetical protein
VPLKKWPNIESKSLNSQEAKRGPTSQKLTNHTFPSLMNQLSNLITSPMTHRVTLTTSPTLQANMIINLMIQLTTSPSIMVSTTKQKTRIKKIKRTKRTKRVKKVKKTSTELR